MFCMQNMVCDYVEGGLKGLFLANVLAPTLETKDDVAFFSILAKMAKWNAQLSPKLKEEEKAQWTTGADVFDWRLSQEKRNN